MESFDEMAMKLPVSVLIFFDKEGVDIILHCLAVIGGGIIVYGIDIYKNKRLTSHSMNAGDTTSNCTTKLNDDDDVVNEYQKSKKPIWLEVTSPRTYRKILQLSAGITLSIMGLALTIGSYYIARSRRMAPLQSHNKALASSPMTDLAKSIGKGVTLVMTELYRTIASHAGGALVYP
jgi:hypothetical protein